MSNNKEIQNLRKHQAIIKAFHNADDYIEDALQELSPQQLSMLIRKASVILDSKLNDNDI